jgi:hypothetical protein
VAQYTVSVHGQDGSLIARLGPVPVMSSARQAMLRHAGLTYLPQPEPSTRSDALEIWVIGDRQYRISYVGQELTPNVQANPLAA